MAKRSLPRGRMRTVISAFSLPVLQGDPGVPEQIHQDLEQLVAVEADRGQLAPVPLEDDAVSSMGRAGQANDLVDDVGHRYRFHHADDGLDLVLLAGHDALDVVDVSLQRGQLIEDRSALIDPGLGQIADVGGELASLFIAGQEVRPVPLVSADQTGHPGERRHARLLHRFDHNAGGHVDAVEDVANIVEHGGGDLGHAGPAGGIHQLALNVAILIQGLPQLRIGLAQSRRTLLDPLLQRPGEVLELLHEPVGEAQERAEIEVHEQQGGGRGSSRGEGDDLEYATPLRVVEIRERTGPHQDDARHRQQHHSHKQRQHRLEAPARGQLPTLAADEIQVTPRVV